MQEYWGGSFNQGGGLAVTAMTDATSNVIGQSFSLRTIEDSLQELEDMLNIKVQDSVSSSFVSGLAYKYEAPLTRYYKKPNNKKVTPAVTKVVIHDSSRFFVIKSSSLSHVRKSFEKGIWSSTHFGNKRLAEAYSQLPEGAELFFLFSITGSGRFCGVAKMVSNLETDLDTSIWENNKKYGAAFRVEWIITKDLRNKFLKHFLIPANEMKPITNSRDTQEVPFSIGYSVLKLFYSDHCDNSSFLQEEYY